MTSTSTGKPCRGRALLFLVLALPLQASLAQTSDTPASTPPPPATASPVPAAVDATTTGDSATPDAATPDSTTAPVPARRRAPHPRQNQTLDDRIAVLSKNLELTEVQRSALKRILIQRQQQTLRIRNSDQPGNIRIGQFRALQDHTISEIRSILTEEQKKKYDPMLVRQIPTPSTPQRSVDDWIKATTPK